MVQLAILYLCLPTLLLAAPVEDGLKQQIAAGLLRNDEAQWNFLNPASSGRHLRRLESLGRAGYGLQKKYDSLSGMTFGNQKRNFDEIDNAGFGAFVKKNFDEIDNAGPLFPVSSKRNFDEIDNAGFGAFLKRST